VKIGLPVLLGILVLPILVNAATYTAFSVTAQTVPSTLEPGESGSLLLTIRNGGIATANNVKLKIQANPYIFFESTSYDLQNIGGASSKSISVPIRISHTANSGVTTVRMTLEYTEEIGGGTRIEDLSVPVNISGSILLRITNITFSEATIEPGETVTININIENVGNARAKNVAVELDLDKVERQLQTGEKMPFVPVGGSTVEYIPEIGPHVGKTVKFTLVVNRDAKTIAYSLPLVLSYKDDLGNGYTKTSNVGFPISGQAEFVVTVEKTERKGDKVELTISLANRGTGPAEFLTVTFPDYASPQEVYVGSVKSDDSETVKVLVDPTITKIPVTVSYKNIYNKEFTFEKELSYTVAPVEANYTWIIVLVLVGIVIIWWYRRRQKRKR
jgi:hypothetical protein